MIATALAVTGALIAAAAVVGIGLAAVLRGSVLRRTARQSRAGVVRHGTLPAAVPEIRKALGELRAMIDGHEAAARADRPGR